MLLNVLGFLRVQLGDRSCHLIPIVADPTQQGVVSLLQALIRTGVNGTGYDNGRQLVYPHTSGGLDRFLEEDPCFSIDAGLTKLGIVPHGKTRHLLENSGPYAGEHPWI